MSDRMRDQNIPFTVEEIELWEKIEDIECPIADCGVKGEGHSTFRRKNPDEKAEITDVISFQDSEDSDDKSVYSYIFTDTDGKVWGVRRYLDKSTIERAERFLKS